MYHYHLSSKLSEILISKQKRRIQYKTTKPKAKQEITLPIKPSHKSPSDNLQSNHNSHNSRDPKRRKTPIHRGPRSRRPLERREPSRINPGRPSRRRRPRSLWTKHNRRRSRTTHQSMLPISRCRRGSRNRSHTTRRRDIDGDLRDVLRFLDNWRALAAAVGARLGYVDDARSGFGCVGALVGHLHGLACVAGWCGFAIAGAEGRCYGA